MAKMTLGQKAVRTLQFLMGLRHPAAGAALAAHGFDEAELDRGFGHIKYLLYGRLRTVDVTRDQNLVAALDEWENKWFPIVSATLASNHPAVHEVVFRNLTQTTGIEVIITVHTLIERVEAQPAAVRELLGKRGLTAEVIAEGKALVEQVGKFAKNPDGATIDAEADAIGERALWAWYLEWSSIARTVISDRRLLRGMGFLRADGSVVGDDEEPEPEPEVDPEPSTDGGGADADGDAPTA